MRKIYLLFVLLCLSAASRAQVSTYTFASSTGTYTPLSSGTPLVPPNSGLAGNGWFEQVYNAPLPFVYYFNGIGHSSVYINSNGYLTFGKPGAASNPRPHTTSNGQSGTIMGYACASTYGYTSGPATILLGGLVDFTNTSPIIYNTTGTAPNRVFVVQWTNAYRSLAYFGASAGPIENLTFQIRLYEGSNVAEVVYNTSVTNYSPTQNAVVGLSGATTADFNLVGGANWSSVTNSSATLATNIPFTAAVSIPSGTTYTFTPPSGLQPTACSGTPASPTVLSTTGITNTSATLSLSGLSGVTGLTYQWQVSATSVAGSWTNVSGATSATYTVTPSASLFYRCMVACGSGTAVASTAYGLGYESAFPAVTSYNYNLFGGFPNGQVGQFSIAGTACGTSFNDVSNSVSSYNYVAFSGTSGTPYNYQDYTANLAHISLLASATSTTSYTATINNNGNNAGAYNVWIDLNDNGSFTDAGELVGTAPSVAGSATNFTLTLPAGSFGIHRMRIRGAFSALGTSFAATGSLSYFGQAIDYVAEITPPPPAPTTNSPLCVNGTLSLTSPALTGGIYTWSGPLSYYATTTSPTLSSTVTTTAASGTYTLYTTVSGANACTPSTTSVTVNLQPSLANATNSGPVCEGTTLNLSANTPANVTGYLWTGPASITASTTASASVVSPAASATGVYTVAVNNGSGSGCTLTYTTSATVNAGPNLASMSTALSSPCVGYASVVSLNLPGIVAGAYTVNYSITGANTFIGNTATLVVSGTTGTFSTPVLGSTGATTITINSVTNSIGCVTTPSTGNTYSFTVNALPSAITGTTSVCAGFTTTLSDAGGGAWSSGNTAIALAGSSSGIISGVTGGTATITYTLPTGCIATTLYTVNQTPPILGVAGTCVGNTTTLSDATAGGTWFSSNSAIATVGSTGIVNGVALGTANISYTLPATGCSSVQAVTITSAPLLFTVTGGGTFCAGSSLPHVFLSGSTVGVGYQLMLDGAATGAVVSGTGSTLDFGVLSTAGTYTVIANPGTSCAVTMTGSVIIAPSSAPIQYNVTGSGAYCAGGAGVNIYLDGSNTSVSYQLLFGSLPSGAAVAGTTAVLAFGARTAAGTYTVLATNTVTGCTNMMLGSVTVSINPVPVAYNVTGGGNYCAGTAGMPVGVFNSETGVNYRLYRGSTAVGGVVAGSSGLPIAFGNQVAGTYTVKGTNATTGCSSNMTGSINVTVTALPAIYTVTGGGAFCAGGAGVTVGLSGSATGVKYQLYQGSGTVGGLVDGTGAALNFGLMSVAGTYTVVASVPSTTCIQNMTGSVTVSVNPLPATFSVTGGGAYCAGTGGVRVGLSNSIAGNNYYLYNGPVVVGGGSGTGYPLDFGLQTTAGTYTVMGASSTTGCAGNMTGSAMITINPLPPVYPVSGGAAYCAGSAAPHILLTPSTSGVDYQLMLAGSPVSSTVPGTGSAIDFGAQSSAGAYTVVANYSATGCMSTMSGSSTVTVNPLPSGYSITGGGNYCTGGSGVRVGLLNSDPGISYQLLNGAPTGAPVTGSGTAIDFGLQTTGGVYTVVATNIATTCTATMPGSTTVGVSALPNAYLISGGGSYCAGGAGVSIALGSSDVGMMYQLFRGFTVAGTAIAGSGGVIDFGLQTVAGNYRVRATNPATGCAVNMTGIAVVSVNAVPDVYAVTGGGNYCPAGTGVRVGLAGSAIGVNYNVYIDGTLAMGSVPGSGSALDFGLQTGIGTYTLIASDPATLCTNNMTGSATVGINALPVIHTITSDGSVACAGGPGVHVGLDGSNAGTAYQLLRDGVMTGTPVGGTGMPVDFGAQTISGGYTVTAVNTATGCTRNMPAGVVVVINDLPIARLVTGGGSYCPGATGAHVGLNGSSSGTFYQLYFGTSAIGAIVTGTGTALDFGAQAGLGSYTIMATNSATGCTNAMTGAAIVTMAPLPVAYTVGGSGAFCASGTGLHVTLSGSNTGINYQLYKSGVASATLAGTNSPLDFGLQLAGDYTVVATNPATTCAANMTGNAAIVANMLPIAQTVTGGGIYCEGGTGVHIQLAGSESGISYQLRLSGIVAGTPVYGTGSMLDFGLKTAEGPYTVTAVNSATGCARTMTGGATVGTNAAPTGYSITGGGSFCADGAGPDITLSNSSASVVYQLYNGTTLVGPPVYGTGSWLDFGTQSDAGTYTIKGVNTVTGCTSTMPGTAVVAVLPKPAAYTVTGGGSFCPGGGGVHVALSGSAAGISYQLKNDGTATGPSVTGTGSTLDFGLQTVSGSYAVTATNVATGCTGDMTGTASVSAGTAPIAYAVSGSSTTGYCVGGSGVAVFLGGSEAGATYQLYRGTAAIGGALTGTGGALSFGPQATAGTYTVMGTSATAGCTGSMVGSVNVSINPLPTVYTVTGGGGYCAGTSGVSIAISGSTSGVSYQLLHSGLPLGAAITGTGAALDLGMQTAAGTYTVVASTSGSGCIANMAGSTTVSVNASPAPFATTGGGSFCAGGAGVHVGLSGSDGGVAYQLGRGLSPVGAAVTGSGSALDFGMQSVSGTYTITATSLTNGCSRSMTGTAVVNAIPVPVPATITGGGAYCAGGAGSPVGLDVATAGVSYRLYRGSTMVGSPVTGYGSALDFGPQTIAGSYTVIAVDPSTSCINNMAGTAVVTINSLPDVFPVTGGGSYCEGAGGVHIGLGSTEPGISYTLRYGSSIAGIYAGTGTMADFGLHSAAGTYTVMATNTATSCTALMSGMPSVTITPVVVPAVSIAVSTGRDTVCAGTLTSFTAISTNGGSLPAYTWKVNGAITGTSASYAYIPLSGDVVSVVMASSAACASSSTVTNDVTITVFDKQLPVVAVSASPGTSICKGSLASFSVMPSYGGSAPSYSWYVNGSATSVGATYNYIPADGDVVTCRMSSNYICRLSNQVTSAPVTLTVDTPATPSVDIAAYPGTHIAAGQPATLVATVTRGGAAPVYSWAINGTALPGATTPTLVYSNFQDGDVVTCNVLSGGGCAGIPGSSSVIMNVSSVGVNTLTAGANDVMLLPNPNNGICTLKGTLTGLGAAHEAVSIDVVDMTGRVVFSKTADVSKGMIDETIRLGNGVANGMYLLNLRSSTGTKVYHMVVEQ